MEREISLELRLPNNKFKKFTQDFVPYHKRHDYIRMEKELEKKAKSQDVIVNQCEYEELQAEFVANLFDSDEVTKELILNGLDAADKELIWEIIRYRVLGFNKQEDDLVKKITQEEILAGVNSTTSS